MSSLWTLVIKILLLNSFFYILENFIVSLAFQALFEDLLYRYKVDLAFWAHYHSYERTCAVYRHTCTPDGIVHIVIGTAGKEATLTPFVPPAWSKFQRYFDPYGYGRVTLVNRSALHFEYFVNSEEKVVDGVWLYKNGHNSLVPGL